jgi:hypothetical protein
VGSQVVCLAVKQKWWSLGCASQRAILDAAGGDRNLLDTLVASFYKSLGIEKRKYRSQEIEPLPPPKPPSGDPVSGTPAALELLRTRLAASGATDNRAFMLKVWQLSHGKRSSFFFSLSLSIMIGVANLHETLEGCFFMGGEVSGCWR